MKRVRIESPTGHPWDTKVFIDQPDEPSIDISECVNSLTLYVQPGEMPRAIVTLLPVETKVSLPESVVEIMRKKEKP